MSNYCEDEMVKAEYEGGKEIEMTTVVLVLYFGSS